MLFDTTILAEAVSRVAWRRAVMSADLIRVDSGGRASGPQPILFERLTSFGEEIANAATATVAADDKVDIASSGDAWP
jgi:hypothetical protein